MGTVGAGVDRGDLGVTLLTKENFEKNKQNHMFLDIE